MKLKQIIRYTNAPALEATWIADDAGPEGGEIVVKCHAYAANQMDMLAADLGPEDAAKYQDLMDEVAAAYVPPPPPTADELLAAYTVELEAVYDAVARERRYDNRLTCALRAGYPGPFQAEGLAFATWMDTCNALGYQVMAEVLGGQRELPTVPEFLALLPPMEWPE